MYAEPDFVVSTGSVAVLPVSEPNIEQPDSAIEKAAAITDVITIFFIILFTPSNLMM
jgi:hypothetical protein